MLSAMAELDAIARADGFSVIFTMIPDIHQLQNYPFSFIHARMKELGRKSGWKFADFFDSLKGYEGPEL